MMRTYSELRAVARQSLQGEVGKMCRIDDIALYSAFLPLYHGIFMLHTMFPTIGYY